MTKLNIAYVVDWQGKKSGSVATKILDQITVWQKLGHTVELVYIGKRSSEIQGININSRPFFYHTKLERVLARWKANSYLKENKNIDLIYRRYGLFLPFEIFLMRRPHILELNTNNNFFYRKRGLLPWIWHILQVKPVGHLSLGACAVTPEIADQNKQIFNKIAVFTNGIEIKNRRQRAPRKSKRDRFVFLAGGDFSWNGYAKLELLASQTQDADFYLVGESKYKAFAANLHILGYLSDKKLEEFLIESTFGLSTLSLENTGLTEAAPLKNRTYLIHGLPIIGTSPDSGFEVNSDFFFILKFNESGNISNLQEFEAFRNIWRTQKISMKQISQIDVNLVELKRLEFIQSLV
ncbi:GT4_PimA-like domain containing protein [Candidatus Nanopelagicaceae bacterium]